MNTLYYDKAISKTNALFLENLKKSEEFKKNYKTLKDSRYTALLNLKDFLLPFNNTVINEQDLLLVDVSTFDLDEINIYLTRQSTKVGYPYKFKVSNHKDSSIMYTLSVYSNILIVNTDLDLVMNTFIEEIYQNLHPTVKI